MCKAVDGTTYYFQKLLPFQLTEAISLCDGKLRRLKISIMAINPNTRVVIMTEGFEFFEITSHPREPFVFLVIFY
jgi:hypothetical protein